MCANARGAGHWAVRGMIAGVCCIAEHGVSLHAASLSDLDKLTRIGLFGYLVCLSAQTTVSSCSQSRLYIETIQIAVKTTNMMSWTSHSQSHPMTVRPSSPHRLSACSGIHHLSGGHLQAAEAGDRLPAVTCPGHRAGEASGLCKCQACPLHTTTLRPAMCVWKAPSQQKPGGHCPGVGQQSKSLLNTRTCVHVCFVSCMYYPRPRRSMVTCVSLYDCTNVVM